LDIEFPTRCFDAARLTDPPSEVQQALEAHPMGVPVTLENYKVQGLRLPRGRWLAQDGTIILVNRKKSLLSVWRPDAEKPDRFDSCEGLTVVGKSYFYDDGADDCAIRNIGWVTLWHALDTLNNAWERGDRATAAALEEWLIHKNQIVETVRREFLERVEELRPAVRKAQAARAATVR
jgi:hypothetical protein